MPIEKTRLKFTVSPQTGELIGFVSRNSKTKQLRGVEENSIYGKKICVLSHDLKGKVLPGCKYDVELKPMHTGSGFVVISAELAQFEAEITTNIVPRAIYQVCVTFGNKTIYYDPKDGKSRNSRTFAGALKVLRSRTDVKDMDTVIEKFRHAAIKLIERMENDGYYLNDQPRMTLK